MGDIGSVRSKGPATRVTPPRPPRYEVHARNCIYGGRTNPNMFDLSQCIIKPPYHQGANLAMSAPVSAIPRPKICFSSQYRIIPHHRQEPISRIRHPPIIQISPDVLPRLSRRRILQLRRLLKLSASVLSSSLTIPTGLLLRRPVYRALALHRLKKLFPLKVRSSPRPHIHHSPRLLNTFSPYCNPVAPPR